MDEKAKAKAGRVEPPEWLGEGEVPWLVYTHGKSKRKQVQTFYSPFLNSKLACLKSIPQLRNNKIVMSQHGWLLLQHRTQLTNLSLFNPLTSQTITLPPLLQLADDSDVDDGEDNVVEDQDDNVEGDDNDDVDEGDDDDDVENDYDYGDDEGDDDDDDEGDDDDDVENDDADDDDESDDGYNPSLSFCLLTMPPNGDECMLVLCLDKAGLLAFCRPAHPYCSWVTQPIELEGKAVELAHMVALNGEGGSLIYGFTLSDVLFCAEAEDNYNSLALKPLQTLVLNPVVDFDADLSLHAAMESCGCLYNIIVYFLERRIYLVKVLELNLQHKQKSWVEVKSLNGRAFFVDAGEPSWCWGDSSRGIAPNCIYVCCVDFLCLYNLPDQTCITLSRWPTLITPFNDPFWIIPQHHQLRLSASEGIKESSIQKTVFVNQQVNPSPIECQDLSQTHHEDEEDGNDILSKLPLDLIELVANHMHLFEYWSFRVSCKILISTLPEPHRRSINDSPLLMVFNQDDRLCTISDPCRHDSRSNKSVLPSHPHHHLTLEFIKSGWVFYLVGKEFLEYANVLTRVHGRFPSLPTLDFDIHFRHHKSVACSTYPTCSKCTCVAIYGDNEKVAFSYIRSGDEVWNTSYFRHEHHPFRPTLSTPVFINGAFYYLDESGYLGEFRLMDEATWHVYHSKPQIQGDMSLTSLVECNGQLYSIFVSIMGNWIRVFRFNYSNKYWVEIHHMENFCFFISRKSSLSVITNDDRMRNKIFLPWTRDKTIQCYSLSSKKDHIWGLDDVRDNLLYLEEPQWSCWF